jgi:hypothetical protein
VSSKPILDRLRALAESKPNLQQFGQRDCDDVHDGRTACTHTVCQYLALAWKGFIPTINDVNDLARMPRNPMVGSRERGMRPEELQTFLTNAKIPMKIVRGRPFAEILEATKNGPVFYGMRYGSAPRATKSHPNGTTQPGIPDTPHAVVLLGFLDLPAGGGLPARRELYRKEPNHGSPRRPEKPPYDTISDRQGRIEYEDYRKFNVSLYAAVPTQTLPVIGTFAAKAPIPPQALVVTDLRAFSGTATVTGDNHFAVQIADREFFGAPNGLVKRVVALGRLEPRLPGPSGDRTNVAIVGDEAAILLRADIVLRDDNGDIVAAPGVDQGEDVPDGPDIPVDDGDPATPDDQNASNGSIPID